MLGNGAINLLLRFIEREKLRKDASAIETTASVVYSSSDMILDLIFLATLAVALYVASRCGGDFRQYAGAILEPYVYLIVRLVVPCR